VIAALLLACAAAGAAPLILDPQVEKQLVLTITATDLEGGILSEITWDNGTLMLQGVIANPDGSLSGRYLVVPAKGTTLGHLKEQTDQSLAYWNTKANRLSPTGLGRIEGGTDVKMPMYGVGSLERRIGEAVDMGGTQHKHVLRLGKLVARRAESHSVRGRQGRPVGGGCRWFPTAAPPEGGLHAARVVGRWTIDCRR
jgi:hypothetical protein